MDAEYLILEPITAETTTVKCAVRLSAPDVVDRVSTHFILLLDISESMSDNNKLENVKRCSSLLLNFMTAEDHVSLITFGDNATLHLNRVPVDEAQKTSIRQTISTLECDGCTNLSAGLGYVREVCEADTSQQKTGILILTDGHANRGVSGTRDLCTMVTSLQNRFPHLSVHGVAYGTDHNAELMSSIATEVQGSYNIVNSMDDTAFAFGETLGGLMSCAYQNVRVEVPKGAVIESMQKTTTVGDKIVVRIGDVFAGTKPVVLFNVPMAIYRTCSEVRCLGTQLPSLDAWSCNPIQQTVDERQKDIELVKLRHTCSTLLNLLNGWDGLAAPVRQGLQGRIDEFATAVADTFLDGHPVTALLREEVGTLRQLLQQAQSGTLNHTRSVMTTQHVATLSLGRGYNTPTIGRVRRGPTRPAGASPEPPTQAATIPQTPARPGRFRQLYRAAAPTTWPAEDSESTEEEDADPTATTSAFQNQYQSRMASLMRHASQSSRSDVSQ